MIKRLYSSYRSLPRPSVAKSPDDWCCFGIIDGKIVPPYSCEVNAVDHCNLSCVDCNHATPAMTPKFADPEIVFRDLSLLSKSYKVQALKIIGGEPLLHPDLRSLIYAVRESGICQHIVLVTNGLLLHQMEGDIWDALDEVEVSLYPETRKILDSHMPAIRGNAAKHRVKLSRIFYEYFRISFSRVGTRDMSLIRRIYRTCLRARLWGCQSIYEGYFFKCPQCIYIPRMVGRVSAYDYRKDGIKITDDTHFQDSLKNYLMSDEPLNACRYCLGNIGKLRAHAMTKNSVWNAHHDVPTKQLIDDDKLRLLEKNETLYDGEKLRL